MFQELKDFFTVTLAKRLSSPFLSSFIFAWCVTNYEITLLIFSGNDWNTKVTFISGIYSHFIDYYPRVLCPFLISLFYIICWPYLDMRLYSVSKRWNVEYKNRQKQIEDITPMTRGDEVKLKEKLSNHVNSTRKEIIEKEAMILSLENKIKELESILQEKRDKEQKEKEAFETIYEIDQQKNEAKVDTNEYTFNFGVSNNLRKIYSKNEKEIKQRTKINIISSMISNDGAWDYIHDIFYDYDKHILPRESDLKVFAWDRDKHDQILVDFIYDADEARVDEHRVCADFVLVHRKSRELVTRIKDEREKIVLNREYSAELLRNKKRRNAQLNKHISAEEDEMSIDGIREDESNLAEIGQKNHKTNIIIERTINEINNLNTIV